MFIKPPNFFLRELPGGFDKLFLVDGLPTIGVTSGSLVLASTDTPPETASILTLTDTLVFDETPDTYTVILQTRTDGAWETVAHDITASPYDVPAVTETRSWRVRATATLAGYANRVLYSNTLTATYDLEAPVNTAAPVIPSTINVGLSATADGYGTWSGTEPIELTGKWQWLDGATWTDIAGEDMLEYGTVSDDYLGEDIKFLVTADNGVGSPVEASSNVVTVTIAAPVATDSLGPFNWIVDVETEAVDASGAFDVPGLPDLDSVTFALVGTYPDGMTIDPDTGVIPAFTPSETFSGPVMVSGSNTSGFDDTTFSVVVTEAEFAPMTVDADPTFGGSLKIGGTLTASTHTWSANPALSGVTYIWYSDDGGGLVEVSGKTSADYGTLTEDLDEAVLWRKATATNSVGSTDAWLGPSAPITYNAPTLISGTAYAWNVTVGDSPYTLDVKTLLEVVEDDDFSGVTWSISGVPSGGGPVVEDGYFEDGVFETGGGPDVEIEISTAGVLTLTHEDLLTATIYAHADNSGGGAEKQIDISIVVEVAAGTGFVSPFFPPPAPSTGYVMPHYEVT